MLMAALLGLNKLGVQELRKDMQFLRLVMAAASLLAISVVLQTLAAPHSPLQMLVRMTSLLQS